MVLGNEGFHTRKEFIGKRSVILVGCLKIFRQSCPGPKKVKDYQLYGNLLGLPTSQTGPDLK